MRASDLTPRSPPVSETATREAAERPIQCYECGDKGVVLDIYDEGTRWIPCSCQSFTWTEREDDDE